MELTQANIKQVLHSCRYTLNVWDVGGQRTLRPYWRNYFEATDAVVWVVDSSDRMRTKDCQEELKGLLQEEVSEAEGGRGQAGRIGEVADKTESRLTGDIRLEIGRCDIVDLCQQAGYSRLDELDGHSRCKSQPRSSRVT